MEKASTSKQSTNTETPDAGPVDLWKGPVKITEEKTREEEFEDYFEDMFL